MHTQNTQRHINRYGKLHTPYKYIRTQLTHIHA